jgi:hypothetical protein
MTDSLLTDEQKEDLIIEIRRWLGSEGIEFFRELKDLNGTVNAFWMEPDEVGNMWQYVPRNIEVQEGAQLRRHLRTLDVCRHWNKEDFETKWVWVLEESIK